MGTKALNTTFPLSTLLCAGCSVKLKKIKYLLPFLIGGIFEYATDSKDGNSSGIITPHDTEKKIQH